MPEWESSFLSQAKIDWCTSWIHFPGFQTHRNAKWNRWRAFFLFELHMKLIEVSSLTLYNFQVLQNQTFLRVAFSSAINTTFEQQHSSLNRLHRSRFLLVFSYFILWKTSCQTPELYIKYPFQLFESLHRLICSRVCFEDSSHIRNEC